MTAQTHLAPKSESQPRRKLITAVPLAMAASSLANLALYWTAGAFFPEVTSWAGASSTQVVGASIVYLLIGTAVFALIRRFSARPARTFRIVATVGLLLSLWMPASATLGFMPGEPASVITAVVLSLMHIVAYAISLPLFTSTLKA